MIVEKNFIVVSVEGEIDLIYFAATHGAAA